MAWELAKINSAKVARDRSIISFSGGKVMFSSEFLQANKLTKMKYVRAFVDQIDMKVGFQFLDEKIDDNCLTIGFKQRSLLNARIGIETLRRYKFIADVERSKNVKDRRFVPVLETSQHGKLWVIRLAPMFEKSVARADISTLPSDCSGIYRYLKNGETVYIGKGQIKRRAHESTRQSWDFDTIEFSVIEREDKRAQDDEQHRWEHYWIRRHKQDHNESRPIYNVNDGIDVDDN